jgi:hypothetical protein
MSGKKIKIVSGAEYWNFEENPIFVGKYQGIAKNEEGKVIGFNFIDLDDEDYIITNSHSIEKALNTEVNGILVHDLDKNLEIIFRGKVTSKSTGKPFNKFDISLLDGDDEEILDPTKKKKGKKADTETEQDSHPDNMSY